MRLPPYLKYKPSGVEWLGDVPEHWDVDRLKWTTSGTVNGIWGEEPNGVDDLICVRVADFDRERFLVVDEPPTLRAVEVSQRKRRLLRKGDLLIEKSGGGEKQLVACVVFFDHDFAAVCSNFVARMPTVPPHSARFWSYAHAALYSGRLNYPAIKQTTGIQNLDSAAYLDTRVGLPPEDEQRAIADFLDRETAKIDTLVAKKRTLIERLKEKRTALISRTVTRGLPPDAASKVGLDPRPRLKSSGIDWLGDVPEHWEVTRLKYTASRIVDCPHETPTYTPGAAYFVVRTADLSLGRLHLSNAYRVDEDEYLLRVRRLRLEAGDIVYGREGERWGFAASVPGSPITCLGQRMMQFRIGRDFNARFVMWHLNASCVYQQGAVDTLGATSPHVNVQTIRNYRLARPTVDEQTAIALFLDNATQELDGMVGIVEAAIERLREYRVALITAAVTGKIDVRDALT